MNIKYVKNVKVLEKCRSHSNALEKIISDYYLNETVIYLNEFMSELFSESCVTTLFAYIFTKKCITS